MNNAFNGIFALFQDFISFLMGCTVVSGVSLFSLFVVGFVFTLLLKFVIAVPHSYSGSHDVSHFVDGEGNDHYQFRSGRWK